ATLFRQIAHVLHVGGGHGFAVQEYLPRIGAGDAGDDADQRGFSGPVRPQQSEDRPLGHLQAYPVQRQVGAKAFYNVLYSQHARFPGLIPREGEGSSTALRIMPLMEAKNRSPEFGSRGTLARQALSLLGVRWCRSTAEA